MAKLVTIAVPIYKRLEFIPKVLTTVEQQTYPDIELLISDNGMNGDVVRSQVQSLYPRRCTFRQNPTSVGIVPHFNQMLKAAAGEYLLFLPDDDGISPNYVAALAAQLEKHPSAVLGFGRQEFVDEAGHVLGKSVDALPDYLSGPDFIRATWRQYAFRFQSVTPFLGKTSELRGCGGWVEFTRGTHMDDALVVKMCLRGGVVFSSDCVYRNLVDGASSGWSVSARELAAAVREFHYFLERDPVTQNYARAHPSDWSDLRNCLVEMSWGAYLWRWRDIYRQRLSYPKWVMAAFALPLIPAFYRRALPILLKSLRRPAQPKEPSVATAAGQVHPKTTPPRP